MALLVSRLLKGIGILGLLCIACIAILLAFLWLEHSSELTLPQPTGSLVVGRTFQDWTDDTKLDTFAPVPGTKHELMVWIWYPSAAAQSAAMDDYIPAQLRSKAGPNPSFSPIQTLIVGFFGLLTRDTSKVHEHSARNSAVSPQEKSYPVVILRAGASASVLDYTTLAEDLASHGYIVIGFDAPYRTGQVTFPDGRTIMRTPENNPELCVSKDHVQQERCANRIITSWNNDIAFVLDRLEQMNTSDTSSQFMGKLDLTRVGVVGHSLGGATAAQFCHDDTRCKVGINIDGAPHGSVIESGMHQPFMFILSDHSKETDPDSQQILADIQTIYDHLPQDSRLRISIRGAGHFAFSDDGALLKSNAVRSVLHLFGMLGIDGNRQLAVTSYAARSYFDAHLKGNSSSAATIASPNYPEIQVLP